MKVDSGGWDANGCGGLDADMPLLTVEVGTLTDVEVGTLIHIC